MFGFYRLKFSSLLDWIALVELREYASFGTGQLPQGRDCDIDICNLFLVDFRKEI